MFKSCRVAVCGVACVVLLAPCGIAETDAYEMQTQRELVEGMRGGLTGWPDYISDEAVVRWAGCIAEFSVEGFTAEEIERLDTFAEGGPMPDSYLFESAMAKLSNSEAADACAARYPFDGSEPARVE